jgi:hypothetical protein
MRKWQENEERQIRKEKYYIPQAMDERRVEPLPVVALMRSRDQDHLIGHYRHGQQQNSAKTRGQRKRAQPRAHSIGYGVLVVQHVLVRFLGHAHLSYRKVGYGIQKNVDHDADEYFADRVVKLLFADVNDHFVEFVAGCCRQLEEFLVFVLILGFHYFFFVLFFFFFDSVFVRFKEMLILLFFLV